MKLLTFQARRFAWKSHSRTLDDAQSEAVEAEVSPCAVVFLHAEARDEAGDEAGRARVLRNAAKHVKWIANKRELKEVVLHSFTHLGAENSGPDYARVFIEQLGERLAGTGYRVHSTPFGWFCEWEISVYGDSLAKVWKEI